MLPERARWITPVERAEHAWLRAEDHCLYFGELLRARGWAGGPTNQLVANFKRSPAAIASALRGRALQYYKDRATETVAQALRRAFGRAAVESVLTFVPIPGSQLPGEPAYCDRLLRALRLAFAGLEADIRPLLRQRVGTLADHACGSRRMRFEALLEITELDPGELERPLRPLVALFDDVLTSGKHLRVARTRIREQRPDQAIIAVCVARRRAC